ncbi:MAG: hypothetical protein HFI42_13800 [Lachnospiraceae bacterium]|nr:hypothetical protein [Lachnospiraceae bacterium]MCI9151539.1 hypothetical protein [Lachnospiraceae bacterium]
MPKANEVNNTKMTAEADPKSAELQADVETKADAAEEKVEAAEVKGEATEKKAKTGGKPGRKPGAKKAAAKKSDKTETVYIQWADQEVELTAIMDKVKAATKSLRAVHEINIYVKPEENRAYYVAKKTRGEEVGSVEL